MDFPLVAVLLLANALFNLIVWPAFFRRVLKDPRSRTATGKATTFLTVHAVLVGVAGLLAVASAHAGIVVLAA